MKRLLLMLTAVSGIAGGHAYAATVSFSHNTATSAVPFTDTFTLPSFDTSLGTLTSIEIDLTTSSIAEVDIFNATGASQLFTNAMSSIPVTVTGPSGAATSQSLIAGPFIGTALVGFNAFPGLSSSATSSVFVSSANFSNFEFPPSATALSFTVTGGSGTYGGMSVPGVFFGGSGTVGGITDIIYTYTTAAPEPMGVALLGVGLAGLGFTRRRH